MPLGVGDRGAAVLLHDNAHGAAPRCSTVRGPRTGSCDRSRRASLPSGRRRSASPASSISSAAATCSALAVELGVEPVVGDHRQQRVSAAPARLPQWRRRRTATTTAPRRRCRRGSGAGRCSRSVAMLVEVVGELAVDHLGRRRGRRRSCRCRRCRAARPAAAACSSRSGSGPTSGWYSARGRKSLLGAEPGAGEQHLADLEQQQRDRRGRRRPRAAIARSASRKLSTWSAICCAKSSSSGSSSTVSVVVSVIGDSPSCERPARG